MISGFVLSMETKSPVCKTLNKSVSLNVAVRCERISSWTALKEMSSHSGVTTPCGNGLARAYAVDAEHTESEPNTEGSRMDKSGDDFTSTAPVSSPACASFCFFGGMLFAQLRTVCRTRRRDVRVRRKARRQMVDRS